eukprot:76053_1
MSVLPTVIITGASQGIGRSIAIALSQTNCYKLALISRNEKKLNQTVQRCRDMNETVEILSLLCDLTNDERLKFSINKIGNEFGPISCLINNAGIYYKDAIDINLMNMKHIDQTLNINLNALIKCCALSVPFIKETKLKYKHFKCTIINIGSESSTLRATKENKGIYCASKWGVLGFTECLFRELRPYGIKACSISPGHVNTPIFKGRTDLNAKNMIQPSDMAETVLYVLNCKDTVCPVEIHLRPVADPYQKIMNNSKL